MCKSTLKLLERKMEKSGKQNTIQIDRCEHPIERHPTEQFEVNTRCRTKQLIERVAHIRTFRLGEFRRIPVANTDGRFEQRCRVNGDRREQKDSHERIAIRRANELR